MISQATDATGECASCGNDLRAKARFCDLCGTPVAPRPATAEHKQVTVLFADVVGSMKLAAALDAERLQEVMNEMFNRAAAVVQRYHGTVNKFTGDGLMALFGAPVALEDHALRACISALEIQFVTNELANEVLRRDGVSLQIRVGLNSGEVIAGEIGVGQGRYTAVGHPVGMAQRMEAATPAGAVMCSLSTARLVEQAARLGPVEYVSVKGADAPVPARQLLAMEAERTVVGRDEGLMLDRDAEMKRLRTLFDTGRGCLVGIVGPPGLGKSRLLSEFTAITADCLAVGVFLAVHPSAAGVGGAAVWAGSAAAARCLGPGARRRRAPYADWSGRKANPAANQRDSRGLRYSAGRIAGPVSTSAAADAGRKRQTISISADGLGRRRADDRALRG